MSPSRTLAKANALGLGAMLDAKPFGSVDNKKGKRERPIPDLSPLPFAFIWPSKKVYLALAFARAAAAFLTLTLTTTSGIMFMKA